MKPSSELLSYSQIEERAFEPRWEQLSLRMEGSSRRGMSDPQEGYLTVLTWDAISQNILAVFGPFTLKLTPSHSLQGMESLLKELNSIARTARVVSARNY